MRDWCCAEAIHFLCFVQFGLLEFQRFCFQRSSCHSFNTSSFWCEYRINHYTELITGQKFPVYFSSHGVLYIEGVETTFVLWSFFDYFHKTTNQLWIENPTMTGLRDCKSCPENVSLSSVKKNWLKKMIVGFLNNRLMSCMFPYTSQIAEEASFFVYLV